MAQDPSDSYLVAPRAPGPVGLAALQALAARVAAIPGARAEPPPAVPGLAQPTPRLVLTLPRGAVAPLAAEFGQALVFDTNAQLGY